MKLYKYRKLPDPKKVTVNQLLSDSHDLSNLFQKKAWLSSRIQFNDPFDSHINLLKPSARELKSLQTQLSGTCKRLVRSWYADGHLTESFKHQWTVITQSFSEMIDTYPMYCFAKEPNNNILWSHYSNNHSGFCIEFEHPEFEYSEVKYQQKLPEISGIEFLKVQFDMPSNLGDLILAGLSTKLDHWQVEQELRHLSKFRLRKYQQGMLIDYPEGSITGIIFGERIEPDYRAFIMKNIPYKVSFKEARIDRKNSLIQIENLN